MSDQIVTFGYGYGHIDQLGFSQEIGRAFEISVMNTYLLTYLCTCIRWDESKRGDFGFNSLVVVMILLPSKAD